MLNECEICSYATFPSNFPTLEQVGCEVLVRFTFSTPKLLERCINEGLGELFNLHFVFVKLVHRLPPHRRMRLIECIERETFYGHHHLTHFLYTLHPEQILQLGFDLKLHKTSLSTNIDTMDIITKIRFLEENTYKHAHDGK